MPIALALMPLFVFYHKNPYLRDIYENVRIMSAKLIDFTVFALLSGGYCSVHAAVTVRLSLQISEISLLTRK